MIDSLQLVAILIDTKGNILEAVYDGIDDGIVIITESVKVFTTALQTILDS